MGPKKRHLLGESFQCWSPCDLILITFLVWAPKKEAQPSEQYQGLEYQEEELETGRDGSQVKTTGERISASEQQKQDWGEGRAKYINGNGWN